MKLYRALFLCCSCLMYAGGEQSKPVKQEPPVKHQAVTTVIYSKNVYCDVVGCKNSATSFWVDTEVGCSSCRCDKHK